MNPVPPEALIVIDPLLNPQVAPTAEAVAVTLEPVTGTLKVVLATQELPSTMVTL